LLICNSYYFFHMVEPGRMCSLCISTQIGILSCTVMTLPSLRQDGIPDPSWTSYDHYQKWIYLDRTSSVMTLLHCFRIIFLTAIFFFKKKRMYRITSSNGLIKFAAMHICLFWMVFLYSLVNLPFSVHFIFADKIVTNFEPIRLFISG